MTATSSVRRKYFAGVILVVCMVFSYAWGEEHAWTRLDEGLSLGTFSSPLIGEGTEESIVVLKIDPRYYRLLLLSSSEHGKKPRAIDQWCREFSCAAAINASMYATDNLTSTGYMQNGNHVNNRFVNARFGAFLVFNPKKSSLPPVQIVDRHHQDWNAIIGEYDCVVQNYRLIGLAGENSWHKKENERISSHAAVGMDREGNVLFIFGPQPSGTHDFGEALLKLPLNLLNAMYVEGGSEASLYLNHTERKGIWGNTWQLVLDDSGSDRNAKLLPNVIGVQKK